MAQPAGPTAGSAASGAATALLNDPEMQAAMKAKGMQALNTAKDGALKGLSALNSYVQSGPAGVSVLCFITGIATCGVGAMGLFNVMGALTSPFSYVLNVYLCIFGFVAFLLESDVHRMESMPALGSIAPYVHNYQERVFEYAKFLTELKGRGAFYIFVGSLAITQFTLLLFIVGAANLFVGVICVMMGFGYAPPDLSAQHLQAQYERLQQTAAAQGSGAPARV